VQFSKYPFSELLKHKSEILTTVEQEMKAEYKKMGITIEYVGIASQFRFSNKDIQNAINNVVAASYNQQAAEAKLAAAKVDRYIAETAIMQAKVEPYKKWDGKSFPNVPQFMISNDSILSWFKNISDAITGEPSK
jgi:hypothetical protein